MKPIYMDYHATTPLDPRVFEAMKPFFMDDFGNASSTHTYGWNAKTAVEKARTQIARILNASSKEIVFTSGATESDNMAILGLCDTYPDRGNHIITSSIEHKAVLDSCKVLEKRGYNITYLKPDKFGRTSVEQIESAITPKTILISIMAANNEVGTINPITEIGKLAKSKNIFFHTDAVQALGRIPLDVEAMNIDLLSISAHKIYGPKGVGALFVRRKDPFIKLNCLVCGGGQEMGMRSGTLNVPGIVGLGKACEIAQQELPTEPQRESKLRDRLKEKLFSNLDEVTLNGDPVHRLPNNLSVSFGYVDSEALVRSLSGIALSTGSACSSASIEPSYVLKALGIPDNLAYSTLRFGLGKNTTEKEVDKVAAEVIRVVKDLRSQSKAYQKAKNLV